MRAWDPILGSGERFISALEVVSLVISAIGNSPSNYSDLGEAKLKMLVIIPAYNEELTIGSVVALSRKYGDVLVVDDGSIDRTSEIARESGAVVVRHEVNGGKGKALRTGV